MSSGCRRSPEEVCLESVRAAPAGRRLPGCAEGGRHGRRPLTDAVAVEEPLEIRLGATGGRRAPRAVSITMRTPGHDLELAVGFLFTEGIVVGAGTGGGRPVAGRGNGVRVELRPGVEVDLARLERHFYTASSCGVCGKASLEAVRVCPAIRSPPGGPSSRRRSSTGCPRHCAAAAVFDRTGGLHAAGLFDAAGELLCLREDVGRHNAVDKVVGWALRCGGCRWPGAAAGQRPGELRAGAEGAAGRHPDAGGGRRPSSLAVDLAREHGLTVLGFVRHDRFNVYSGAGRPPAGDRPPKESAMFNLPLSPT